MISVVIATMNDEVRLVPTLASLIPAAADGLVIEALIADGGSVDDTERVADIAGCKFLNLPGLTGERLKTAGLQARAPWLLIVTPGTVLDEGWLREVRQFIETVSRAGETGTRIGVFRLGIDGYGLRARFAETRARARLAMGLGAHAAQGLLISAPHFRRRAMLCTGPSPIGRLTRAAGARHITVFRARATALALPGA